SRQVGASRARGAALRGARPFAIARSGVHGARLVRRPREAMIVRCEGLTKRFAQRRTWADSLRSFGPAPRVTVVSGVSDEVQRGEIFGLLGQNGAGKSTLFRMLATLLVPDEGSASVDGHDIGDSPDEV